jgi:hypothetical protein
MRILKMQFLRAPAVGVVGHYQLNDFHRGIAKRSTSSEPARKQRTVHAVVDNKWRRLVRKA